MKVPMVAEQWDELRVTLEESGDVDERDLANAQRSFYAGVLATLNFCRDIAGGEYPVSAIEGWAAEAHAFALAVIAEADADDQAGEERD